MQSRFTPPLTPQDKAKAVLEMSERHVTFAKVLSKSLEALVSENIKIMFDAVPLVCRLLI